VSDHLPFSTWLVAFVWTNALELPIYVLFLRRRFTRWWEPCLLCGIVNAVSHPAFWYLFPRFGSEGPWLVAAESTVTAIEAAIVFSALVWRARVPARNAAALALGASIAANLFSTLAGFLIWQD
jgi:hypothetical protein